MIGNYEVKTKIKSRHYDMSGREAYFWFLNKNQCVKFYSSRIRRETMIYWNTRLYRLGLAPRFFRRLDCRLDCNPYNGTVKYYGMVIERVPHIFGVEDYDAYDCHYASGQDWCESDEYVYLQDQLAEIGYRHIDLISNNAGLLRGNPVIIDFGGIVEN